MKQLALRYEADAQSDLERIADYGTDRDHSDPERYVLALGDCIAMLREQPKAGRAGRVEGTREMVIAGTAYITVHQLGDNGITVLRVLHGAQQWPSTTPSTTEELRSGS